MGLGAGGRIEQKIYPDPHGVDTWDPQNFGSLWVHLLNSEEYQAVTGREPPPTPIDARTYTEYGFPWFELFDEERGDVPPSERLASVKGVRERQAERGEVDAGEGEVEVPESQVWPLRPLDRQE